MADPDWANDANIIAGSHPSISNVEIDKNDQGGFSLKFLICVQSVRDGRKNDIREFEPVEMLFPLAWPMKAPEIRLRSDFCRSIAHINGDRTLNQDWVNPCIVDIPLDIFARNKGLYGLLDQLQLWLDNVAFDNLRISDGKWEPMRRDGLPFFAIANIGELRSKVKGQPGSLLLQSEVHQPRPNNFFIVVSEDAAGHDRIAIDRISQNPEGSLTLLTWGTWKTTSGDVYPDGFTKVSQLIEASKHYGCTNFLPQLNSLAQKSGQKGLSLIRILVVLAVRRPLSIQTDFASEETNIELVSYLMALEPEKLAVSGKTQLFQAKRDSIVYPANLRQKSTPNLLQRISNVQYNKNQKISLLGCGSLGSKLAMNLGKAGFGKMHLVDSSAIMPHNLSRMGLMIDHHIPQIAKAEALATELLMLNHKATFSLEDIVENSCENKAVVVPHDTTLIVDTTASQSVHDIICKYPNQSEQARIAQASFFADGTIAYLALNSLNNDVDIEHLSSHFWRLWMDRADWPGGDLGWVELGEGCGSLTMTMSNMQASLLSAGISTITSNWLSGSFPQEAQFSYGVLSEDGCGVVWKHHTVPATINCENRGNWQVDILPAVDEEIKNAVAQSGKLETGGYLMGRVNWVLQRITITAQLDAPADSIEDENHFELGIEGAGEALHDIYLRSQKAFIACGTWHSHPRGGGASAVDLSTLNQLAHEAIGLPMISLIWREEGYLAITQQELENVI